MGVELVRGHGSTLMVGTSERKMSKVSSLFAWNSSYSMQADPKCVLQGFIRNYGK